MFWCILPTAVAWSSSAALGYAMYFRFDWWCHVYILKLGICDVKKAYTGTQIAQGSTRHGEGFDMYDCPVRRPLRFGVRSRGQMFYIDTHTQHGESFYRQNRLIHGLHHLSHWCKKRSLHGFYLCYGMYVFNVANVVYLKSNTVNTAWRYWKFQSDTLQTTVMKLFFLFLFQKMKNQLAILA